METDKIFTKERVIYGILLSIIGMFGTYITAIVSSSKPLDAFRVEVTKEIGSIKAEVQTNKAVNEQQYKEINRRLESIDGSLNTLTSAVYKAIQK